MKLLVIFLILIINMPQDPIDKFITAATNGDVNKLPSMLKKVFILTKKTEPVGQL